MMEISALPGEMLMRVFGLVPPRDRKKVVLVSKRWREVGEHPSLWNCCRVRVRYKEDINTLDIALSSGRVQRAQEICINSRANWQAKDWEAMFQTVMKIPRLKKIDFGVNNLVYCVEPELFARVVNRMEDVNLCDTYITGEQKNALFAAISQKTHLKKLNFGSINLSSIYSELFAKVVTRLEEVDLEDNSITGKQRKALFTAMSQSTQLKKLNLAHINLKFIDPDLFGRGVTSVEDVNLCHTKLTNEQLLALFTAMSQNSCLKKLILKLNNLSAIDQVVLASAVTRLEYVDLMQTGLSFEQITTILAHVQEKQLRGGHCRIVNEIFQT